MRLYARNTPSGRSPRRLAIMATALAILAAAFAASSAAAAPAHRRGHAKGGAKPTIVLVHGAWADGSSWNGVTSRLQEKGYTVRVPPNPLRGVASDAAYLDDYLKTVRGPIVLAGHSYGGAVITNVPARADNVKALVYVDAFIPDEGDSLVSLLTPPGGPPPDPTALYNFVPFPGAPAGDADVYLKPAAIPLVFANGLSHKEQALLAATQRPLAANALTEKSGPPAWKTLPSWAVIGLRDKSIPPALQQTMTRRAGSHVTEVNAPHVSMIARPGRVAAVVEKAARSVH